MANWRVEPGLVVVLTTLEKVTVAEADEPLHWIAELTFWVLRELLKSCWYKSLCQW